MANQTQANGNGVQDALHSSAWAVLDAIKRFKRLFDGNTPTYEWLAEECDLAKSVIHYHVDSLVEAELLKRGPGRHHLIVVGGRWEHRPAEPPLHVSLDGVRPETWNVLKRLNKHAWHEEVIAAAWMMREALGPEPPVITGRLDIEVITHFDKNPYDSDNIPAKLFIDGLKNFVIPDDRPKYVRRVTTESRIDRRHPRVEVLGFEVGES